MLSDEKRLIKRLLKNYEDAGITGRPVKRTDERVQINMSLSLIQILDLDEKNQVLTISVWLLFNWKDHILQWDPNNYSQVVEVRVPPKQIWTPDIVLYNYADERLKEMRDAMVIVYYDGSIKWMPPAIFKSNCKIDIKSFPFDEQTCHMKFGSWTYDGNRLDVLFIDNEQHVLLDDYTESNEWEIIARPAMRNVKFYPCCQEPYPDLTYFLFLRRNAAFFSYILVLPCVLLSSLTLVIFWLPPESPAKMVLGMNIFVAFFLLLLLLADSTPQASNSVPYIGYYYCLNMILITLSSFLSVIVINLYFRGDRRNRVPRWLRQLCQLVNRSCTEDSDFTVSEDKIHLVQTSENNVKPVSNNKLTSLKNNQLAGDIPLIKCKPILTANGQQAPDRVKNDTAAARKKKKVRTRFVTTQEDDGNSVEKLLTAKETKATSEQKIFNSSTTSDYQRDSQERSGLDRVEVNTREGKFRSQSLSPFRECTNESTRDVHVLSGCQLCWNGIQPNTVCRICASQSSCMRYQMGCTCVPGPEGNVSSQVRHQRHPQSCPVCLQHLDALRTQQTGRRTPCTVDSTERLQPYCTHYGHPSSVNTCFTSSGGLNCTERHKHAQVCDHRSLQSHQPTVTCDVHCNQVKYEYRDGQLVLLPTCGLDTMTTTCQKHTCPKRKQEATPLINEQASIAQFTSSIERDLQDIRQVIRSFLDRVSKKDAANVVVREWRMVAMVLDRIFFVFYLIIHLCAAFGLLIPSSHEANVIDFMREYRLKNYNATYTDEEASHLFPLALSPVSPEDKVFGRSLDRPTPARSNPADQPDLVIKVPSSSDTTNKVLQQTSDKISSLSPYQRLADKQHAARPKTDSLLQSDQKNPPSDSGQTDAN
ncbi:Acetylcholine receptor subunit alpha 2 [Paragonimus heterotremus]|uniref:Acetylcholine receptor subunit alpha 2 n=1 Tax=Paragonimus heterotremus TaxID=100268 RepID=A0A8J4TLW1_9TREM|nr:Acetylcholine receptor subunit alpha 2 [Paragonimus heterotremus]